jgi:hypothetical protein
MWTTLGLHLWYRATVRCSSGNRSPAASEAEAASALAPGSAGGVSLEAMDGCVWVDEEGGVGVGPTLPHPADPVPVVLLPLPPLLVVLLLPLADSIALSWERRVGGSLVRLSCKRAISSPFS